MTPLLRARALCKRYRTRTRSVDAVRGISFEVQRGAVFALLGENGAGKSTVMRMCIGLLIPDSGEVLLDGSALLPGSEAIRSMGALLEGSRNLYWRLTPLENLEYFGGLKGMARCDARQHGLQLLERFDLLDRRAVPVQTLSRGMQQRLSLMCSLVHRPDVLFLDEPTLGLDFESSQAIVRVILQCASEGVAIVMTSHQIDLVEDLATDVAIMFDGRVTAAGTMRELVGGQEGLVDVVLGSEVAKAHCAELMATFPQIRIVGNKVTLFDRAGALHALLRRLSMYPLVSVTTAGKRLEDVFRRAALKPNEGT